MPTCGYICPGCEGKGFLETGETCSWCIPAGTEKKEEVQTDNEEWIDQVHNGPCCGDLGREQWNSEQETGNRKQ